MLFSSRVQNLDRNNSEFSGVIYSADTNLIYGREMKRLQEIIQDMEALQQE